MGLFEIVDEVQVSREGHHVNRLMRAATKLVDSNKLTKAMVKRRQGLLMQLSLSSHYFIINIEDQRAPQSELEKMLDSYADVFDKPMELPPKRAPDHHIPLMPNVAPITIHLYRYHVYRNQKLMSRL